MLRYSSSVRSKLDTIAAVDLGSNSFHMIVAKVVDNNFQVIDRLRDMVQLSAGLNTHKQLSWEVEERALACLHQFGQRLRSLPPGSVRAVGTSALRQIRDSRHFLQRAESALGHPIEIISGREEARLVYLGAAHGLAAGDERRLIVDIGGGSTELTIGEGNNARYMESIHVGCVNIAQGYFQDGTITAKKMRTAELVGALEMLPIQNELRAAGWQQAIGTSGTIKAIQRTVVEAGWVDEKDGITSKALKKLSNRLIDIGDVQKISYAAVNPERRPVFPGGVAILSAAFKALQIERMHISEYALREGLLSEMLGPTLHEDIRESAVRAMCRRHHVDMEHTGRVEATARNLLYQTAETWKLEGTEYADLLGWAARLHEIGLTVSHSQFHKHGAYLIAYSDMQGFSKQEHTVLSALIRGSRRKFPTGDFEMLPEDIAPSIMRLCVLLRLAVLLNRARSAMTPYNLSIHVKNKRITLDFPEGWLEAHTLPRTELKQEAKRLKSVAFKLQFS